MNADDDMIEKVKELWIDTFHDSREYVGMVIDHYYDDNLCRRRYIDGRLISSAIMIPYSLKLDCIDITGNITAEDGEMSNRNIPRVVKCGYLCGLATNEEWRGRGIMASLISETEDAAIRNGFSAVTLIPADERLRKYYSRLGYRDMSNLHFVDAKYSHNDEPANIREHIFGFSANIAHSDMSHTYIENSDMDICTYETGIFCIRNLSCLQNILTRRIVDLLIDKCRLYEEKYCDNVLMHDSQQWNDIFCDLFRDGDKVCFSVDNPQNITDMILQYYLHSESDRNLPDCFPEIDIKSAVCMTTSLKVIPLFGKTESTQALIGTLLRTVRSNHVTGPDLNFSIQCSDAKEAGALIEKFSQEEKLRGFEFSIREEKYGMIKFLQEGSTTKKINYPDPSLISMRLMLD